MHDCCASGGAQRRLAVGGVCLAALLFFAAPSLLRRPDVGDPSLLDSPLVTAVPSAYGESESFAFSDARGSYLSLRSFPAAPGGKTAPYVNVVHSREGQLRSGDMHACEQLNVVLFGQLRLTRVYARGRSVVTQHAGGEVLRIPPFVPHLYLFLTDTLMTETWREADGSPCPFSAWVYAPLREQIPAASAANKTFTRLPL